MLATKSDDPSSISRRVPSPEADCLVRMNNPMSYSTSSYTVAHASPHKTHIIKGGENLGGELPINNSYSSLLASTSIHTNVHINPYSNKNLTFLDPNLLG